MGKAKKSKQVNGQAQTRPLGTTTSNGIHQRPSGNAPASPFKAKKPYDPSAPRGKGSAVTMTVAAVPHRDSNGTGSNGPSKVNLPPRPPQSADGSQPSSSDPAQNKRERKARNRARRQERDQATKMQADNLFEEYAAVRTAKGPDSAVRVGKSEAGPSAPRSDPSRTPTPAKQAPFPPIRLSRLEQPIAYHPIRQYDAHHLAHPFRELHPDTTFDIPAVEAIRAAKHSQGPSEEYLEMALEAPAQYTSQLRDFTSHPPFQKKLLVQDLNGAILVREQYRGASQQRKVSPRPFLDTYLDYLFKHVPAPTSADRKGKGKVHPRPWECFVWSSATPPSCADMVHNTFEKHAATLQPTEQEDPGRILGIWTRQNMGLSHKQYNNKSDTVKDLGKVCELLRAKVDGQNVQGVRAPEPPFKPNLFNTLLLDDSVKKAIPNPFSHIPIPEYAKEQRHMAEQRARGMQKTFNGLPKRTFDGSLQDQDAAVQERVAVFQFAFSGSPYEIINESQPSDEAGDIILLCVIGVLEELKDVLSIPAWIAAGGLSPTYNTFDIDPASTWDQIARQDTSAAGQGQNRRGGAGISRQNAERKSGLQLSPNDPHSPQWYESSGTQLYWLRRGLLALDSRQLPIRNNLGAT